MPDLKTAPAKIRVAGFKVSLPLSPGNLPPDLVPMDGPVGEPVIDLVLDGGSMTARAKINGKSYRKMLKQILEQGEANVIVILQGMLRPPPGPGQPFTIEGAGFQVTVKTPKPDQSQPAEATAT